ncbi:hypothetical protein [Gelidibacter japonicus]|uniref:hypothetical protein n=1 Tax=Gelidibacter japonicus TaxID=1962232 RepID=UPI0013D31F8A|nr:hypothetical protein [Gelidibacter japonicus]
MRLIIMILLYVLALSCTSNQSQENQELAVIAAVYKMVPKELPPPPPPPPNSEVKEENNINYSKLKPLAFNYAINENFVYYDFDYINGISNRFIPYKSNELFQEKILDSSYMKLVERLSELKEIEKIDKAQLDKIVHNDIVFWDKQTITIEEKKENNLSGIISFSKVAFNDEFTRAVVVVGNYFEHIGGGVGLYILEKIDNNWVIKYTKTLIMS